MNILDLILSWETIKRPCSKHLAITILGIKIKFLIKKEKYNLGNNNFLFLNQNGTKTQFFEKIEKLNIDIEGTGNTIEIDDSFKSLKDNSFLNISIQGNNCQIKIGKFKAYHATIEIKGNNHKININDSESFFLNTNIFITQQNRDKTKKSHDCLLQIGKNAYFGFVTFILDSNNTSIILGDDCLLSSNVYIHNHDSHAILDSNGNILNNKNYSIVLKDHVWIGRNAYLTKNTKLAKNTVVGAGSVVTKEFTEENIVIAGNPAKIIKRDVNWDFEPIL